MTESKDGNKELPAVLMPKIECIHPGATRNHNRYVADRLKGNFEKKSGIFSWTYPYPKPMIYNHDPSEARDISGRIYNAQYVSNGVSGKEAVVIIPRITNKEDIRRILDGELLTVSIGASTDSAVCSICGTDVINEEWCGHWRGETYDGAVCEYIMGDIWFDECSWVTVPADVNAQVVDLGEIQTAEAFAQVGDDFYALNRESASAKLQKGAAITEGLIIEGKQPLTPKPSLDQTTNTTQKEGTQKVPEAWKNLSEAEVESEYVKLTAEAAKVTVLNTTIETLTTEKATAEADKAKAESDLAEATRLKDEAEVKAEEAATAKTALEEANAALKAQLKESLIERVLDQKMLLGRASHSERESLKAELSTRSEESLKDTLSDLVKEATSGGATAAIIGSVKNPAAGVTTTENLDGENLGEDVDPINALTSRLLRR